MADDLILAENTIGYHINQGLETNETSQYVSDVLYLGVARTDCDECYADGSQCSNLVAFRQPTFDVAPQNLPGTATDPISIMDLCT